MPEVKGPLAERCIVVTRAAHQASELSAKLRALGARPVEYPVIAIAPPEDLRQLDQAISLAASGAYDWIVFTSANGVAAVSERLRALRIPEASFGRARIAAIGPATARAVREILGREVDVMPTAYVAETLASALGDVRGQRILLARADIARPALPQALREAGAEVREVAAYRTIPAQGGPDVPGMLRRGEIDAVTFTSSSTVRNFLARVGREMRPYLQDVVIACIGPITAKTVREAGLTPTIVARTYTIDGLIESLIQYYGTEGVL